MSGARPSPSTRAEATESSPPNRDWRPWLAALIIVGATVAAYANSFDGVFIFDDDRWIVSNPVLDRPDAVAHSLTHSRPLLRLSIVFNHALGGLEPFGYHLFNLAVHVLAALTLFGVCRRTLRLEAFRASVNPAAATWLGLAIALLWAVHPLQTQSVTYVIQRGEAMMGLGYLLTLYCVVRGAEGKRPGFWYAGAVATCALGMAAKSIIITAPLTVLAYDLVFLRRSSRPLRTRWPLYAGLLATWVIPIATGVVASVFRSPETAQRTVGFAVQSVSPVQYALSQPGVVLHYLRLAVWPLGLTLDYGWPVARGVALFGPLIGIGLLGLATLWALWRRPWLGFLGVWFFVILAPTSSILPVQDLAVEHRMYLSLAAVVAVAVLAAHALFRRMALPAAGRGLVLVVTAAVLIVLTVQRNRVYGSAEMMWRDVVARRPDNPRGYQNLGKILSDQGRTEEAIATFRRSLQVRPDQPRVLYNLAYHLSEREQKQEAIDLYRRAVDLNPRFVRAHFNLGNALYHQGDYDGAIRHYRLAREQVPHRQAAIMIGNALSRQNRLEEAADAYRLVTEADATGTRPEDLGLAHTNLGNALARLRRYEEAVASYRAAIAVRPTYAKAHTELGWSLLALSKPNEAAAAFEAALKLDPASARAREGLERARQSQG